jgi:type II secretory pathway component GspD/PulD (secretin)
VRVRAIKECKGLAGPSPLGNEDNFVLQVMPVRFFSVAEMKKLLTPFATPGGEILEFPRGNFLMIMDLSSNIQRLIEIRDLIDVNVFAGTRMEIYQPKVASAEELAVEMTKIMQAYASSTAQAEGFAAEFLPVPRINQLLVINHSEAAWTYVKRWLERIDTVGEGPGRRIFIYPVENGKATDLADILNQVLGRPLTGRRETPRTLEQLHRGTPSAPGAPGAARPFVPSLGVQQPLEERHREPGTHRLCSDHEFLSHDEFRRCWGQWSRLYGQGARQLGLQAQSTPGFYQTG